MDMTNSQYEMDEVPRPGSSHIRILLHGLLLSSFKKNMQDEEAEYVEFDVGALNPDKAINNHNRLLQVTKIDSSNAQHETETISIDADSTIFLTGVSETLQPFKSLKGDGTWHENDFRWVLDYEKLYGDPVCKIEKRIGPHFLIKHGLVHTLIRSSDLILGDHPSTEYRRVTQVMAVDIPIKEGEPPKLYVRQGEGEPQLAYEFESGKRYNVAFRYDCGDQCQYHDPGEPLDLNYLNQAFDVPTNGHAVFYHKYQDPDTIDGIIQEEIDRAEREDKYALVGLEDIFHATAKKEGTTSRSNPCGMGYFGETKSDSI